MVLCEFDIQNAKSEAKPDVLTDGGGLFLPVQPNRDKLCRLKYRRRGTERRADASRTGLERLCTRRPPEAEANASEPVIKGGRLSTRKWGDGSKRSDNSCNLHSVQNWLVCRKSFALWRIGRISGRRAWTKNRMSGR
jgi:hypothetical protein